MAVTFLDTTLRDGAQGLGIHFSLQDKLDITERLDAFGIDYIEGGFPLASERESEYFRRAKALKLKHAKLVAFGSTRRPGAAAEHDAHIQSLLEAETPAVVVVGKGWDAHVRRVIGTDLEENLRMIDDSLVFLKQREREVIIDIEHFFDAILRIVLIRCVYCAVPWRLARIGWFFAIRMEALYLRKSAKSCLICKQMVCPQSGWGFMRITIPNALWPARWRQ